MSNFNILGPNLRKERESLGYKKKDVARKMGFPSYQTLSDIEDGKREIKAWELFKLAELYGRKTEYFMPRGEKLSEPRVLWRNPSSTSERLRGEKKFLSFFSNYRRLLDLVGEGDLGTPLNRFCIPDKSAFRKRGYEYVNDLAQEQGRLLNLGSRPACCLSDILEQTMGILVLYFNLGPGGSGASTSSENGGAILINSNDAPWRRNYDLAHEFFHIITWNIFSEEEVYSLDAGGKSEVEQWADLFASELLLPENEVRKEFLKRVSNGKFAYIDLVQIARDFKVSIDALLWRLVNLKFLDKRDVSKCLTEGKVKEIDRQVRADDWEDRKPYLSTRYISLAIKALETGRISKLKFSEYLDIPFSEASNYLTKYGYNEAEDYSLDFATT